jgi:hypothetical protein
MKNAEVLELWTEIAHALDATHAKGIMHSERQVLFDHIEIAQIVVDGDAGIVDEDVEGVDLVDRPLDLRNAGHVQRQGRHAVVGVLQCAARSRIDSFRPPSKSLIDERLTDAGGPSSAATPPDFGARRLVAKSRVPPPTRC